MFGLAKKAFVNGNIDVGQAIGSGLKRVNQLDDLAGLAIVYTNKRKQNQNGTPDSENENPQEK